MHARLGTSLQKSADKIPDAKAQCLNVLMILQAELQLMLPGMGKCELNQIWHDFTGTWVCFFPENKCNSNCHQNSFTTCIWHSSCGHHTSFSWILTNCSSSSPRSRCTVFSSSTQGLSLAVTLARLFIPPHTHKRTYKAKKLHALRTHKSKHEPKQLYPCWMECSGSSSA